MSSSVLLTINKLLKCKEGYHLENNQCLQNCYELCETCTEKSTDEKNQKCTKCISDFDLDDQTGNCNEKPTTIIIPPTTIITTIPQIKETTIITEIPTTIINCTFLHIISCIYFTFLQLFIIISVITT